MKNIKKLLIAVGIMLIGIAVMNVIGAEIWDLSEQMQRWWE